MAQTSAAEQIFTASDGTNWLVRHCVVMPRYFFHIHSAHNAIPDLEGMELSSPLEAHEAAIEALCLLLYDDASEGRPDPRARIEVTDARNMPVMTMPYAMHRRAAGPLMEL